MIISISDHSVSRLFAYPQIFNENPW